MKSTFMYVLHTILVQELKKSPKDWMVTDFLSQTNSPSLVFAKAFAGKYDHDHLSQQISFSLNHLIYRNADVSNNAILELDTTGNLPRGHQTPPALVLKAQPWQNPATSFSTTVSTALFGRVSHTHLILSSQTNLFQSL